MPEVNITADEIIQAIGKALLERWKLISVIAFFSAAMFFAGGWFVYKDAQANAVEMKLKVSEAVMEVYAKKAEAEEDLDNLSEGVNEAQKALDRIVMELNQLASEYERSREALLEEQEALKSENKEKITIEENDGPGFDFTIETNPTKDSKWVVPKEKKLFEKYEAPKLPQIQQKAPKAAE